MFRALVILAILAGAAAADPLAVGEAVPAGTDWIVQVQADTLVTGTGYLRFDQDGDGVSVLVGSPREAALVWLYATEGGVVVSRQGPLQLRYDDGPQSLTPFNKQVHLLQ